MYAGINMPEGFLCAGIIAGIKPGGAKDMALIFSEAPAVAAGVFTTNQICAAPVKVCRTHLQHGRARAVIINSGTANSCTGEEGLAAAREICAQTARMIGCHPREILVCSTGKIGPKLPMERVISGIEKLFNAAENGQVQQTAEAMMTTDTRPKISTAQLRIEGKTVKIVGFAKGAGMIEPNMATMLSCIATDAAVERDAWQDALKQAVDASFNRISIDGDQSTNDTVLALANGAAGIRSLNQHSKHWEQFLRKLEKVCFELAMMIVHDGEGADRFVTISVKGAVSDEDAGQAARSVANSMLNKTAWAGGRPDWGRIMAALGSSKAKVIEGRVDIFYDNIQAVAGGCRSEAPEERLISVVSQTDFPIHIDLGLGRGDAAVYTCNCTEEYVRINR